MAAKYENYEDAKGEHRWRTTGGNGEKIGGATEGFSSSLEADCNALRQLAALARAVPQILEAHPSAIEDLSVPDILALSRASNLLEKAALTPGDSEG